MPDTRDIGPGAPRPPSSLPPDAGPGARVPQSVRTAIRLYALSYLLYPRGFRIEYSADMAALFGSLAREAAARSGSRGVWLLLVRAWGDAIRAAWREHLRRRKGSRSWHLRRPAWRDRVASVGQDVRYAFRSFVQRPGFAAASVITLSLGIGANTAIFSIVNGVLLQPLPFEDADRLVVLEQAGPFGPDGFSVPELEALRTHATTLESVVEYHSLWFNLLADGDPERVLAGVVSWNFFETVGVQPHLGRTFRPADDVTGAPPVLVLSYDYWQRGFGGDPSVVGRVLLMNDREYTVVGILPGVPQYPRDNDVYMPTVACPYRSSASWIENPAARTVDLFSRVRADVDGDSLAGDIRSAMQVVRAGAPERFQGAPEPVPIVSPLRERLVHDARPTFLALLATVGVVLLVALANVANLSLANLVRRDRELTVRVTLGATRARLMRQLMTESTLLALIGGVVGLGLAAAGMDLLVRFAERFTPRAAEIAIDGWVLIFTLGVSIGTGVLFGALPALPSQARRSLGVNGGLSSQRGANRLRKLLVVSQLALSFVVLIVAGLMVRTTMALQRVEPGFREENVVTMTIAVPFTRPASETPAIYERLLPRVEAFPRIVSVSIATAFPLGQNRPGHGRFERSDAPTPDDEAAPIADFRLVAPHYFDVIQQPVVAGRAFTWEDVASSDNVVLVNEHLARRYFGDESSAVGRRLNTQFGNEFTIIGVVGDVRQHGLAAEVTNELYLGLGTLGGRTVTMLARGQLDEDRLADHVRAVLRDLDPEVAVADVRTLEQVRRDALASPLLATTLLSLFGVLALAITATGIAGVIGFSVSQRTHEIGVRRALGARRTALIGTVLRQGMMPVAAGLALGIAGSIALTRVLRDLLYGVGATDPVTFLGVAVVLSGVAVCAAFVPARRAVSIDPMTALRSD